VLKAKFRSADYLVRPEAIDYSLNPVTGKTRLSRSFYCENVFYAGCDVRKYQLIGRQD
jgi:hypothetical protein